MEEKENKTESCWQILANLAKVLARYYAGIDGGLKQATLL